MSEKIDSKDAKQGRKGSPVLKVLAYSLILLGVAWIAAELIYDGDPAANDGMVPSAPVESSTN